MDRCENDCDDFDANVYPGIAVNDSMMDCMRDADGDGYGDSTAPTDGSSGSDCDDADSQSHPNAPEMCDWIDNDCNGILDDNPINGIPLRECSPDRICAISLKLAHSLPFKSHI